MQKIKRMLKRIVHSSGQSDKVIVCPRCGSTRLSLSSKMDVWLTPKKYFCADCGYVGPIVMEIERKELKKEEN